MRPKDWARARAYLHDGKEMYKRCDACALLLHGNKRSLYLLTQRNYGIIRNFGKKQTHENCSWCQDLTVTIFAGTPFVQELLFEILYAGQSRNISKFGTHLSLSLPFKFPENPVGKWMEHAFLDRSSGRFSGATEHQKS